ncbi:hypothetical protein GWK08_01485 [Leptobacterium flavescens]|uniref:Glycosyl hydrolase family 43 n=1 Tax=Leptobacterium flavescens TaxID=472055 RepID=A0A6P0UFP4_9FLAO|nr:PD40 domain-containing protein [Leptobacterium flavescens]NER12101.1 hypothetical protein [Leptobacterium flavescens]
MKNKLIYLSIIGLAFILQSCKTRNSYFGQDPPGTLPELFAPSLVNTDAIEINAVYNASFTELFFTRIIDDRFVIHHSELIDGNWTKPQPIQMYEDQKNASVAIDPSITQDGNTMYFLGINPVDRSKGSKPDIYRSQKIDGKWQIAEKVGYPISTEEYAESYPVVVADGSIYFTSDRPESIGKRDIFRAQYLGEGKFDTPVNIGTEINSKENQRSTYVSPDESFLITGNTYTKEGGFAISFKKDNKWQTPVYFDLGEPLEKNWIYFCPYMSPDNKYFFFSKRYSDPVGSGWKGAVKGEVYWVDIHDILKSKRN